MGILGIFRKRPLDAETFAHASAVGPPPEAPPAEAAVRGGLPEAAPESAAPWGESVDETFTPACQEAPGNGQSAAETFAPAFPEAPGEDEGAAEAGPDEEPSAPKEPESREEPYLKGAAEAGPDEEPPAPKEPESREEPYLKGAAEAGPDEEPPAPKEPESYEERYLKNIERLAFPAAAKPAPEPEKASAEDWPPAPDPQSELGRLRTMILGREIAQVEALRRTLTEPGPHAKAVSQVITEALLLRSKEDDKLGAVLRPTVERIFKASVDRDPEALASQLFPVIGPAIRRSVSEALFSKLQSFNTTLETSLSLKGLKWRVEALRTRKTFSEIVLLKTLVYQVEEIFLIHAETGTALEHLQIEGLENRDTDMVGSMLTAILSFIRDSFTRAGHDNLETMQFGERTIYFRRSGQMYLACVVLGSPPAALPQELQEALDLIVVECAEDMANFSGDIEGFKKARRYLSDFLIAKYKEKPRQMSFLSRVVIFMIIAALLGGAGWLYRRHYEEIQRQEATAAAAEQARIKAEEALALEAETFRVHLDELDNTPGLVLVRVAPSRTAAPWEITVLKDVLAREPEEILLEKNLPPGRFKIFVHPYLSLDHEIVKARVESAIEPLPGVEMTFDDAAGVLKFAGSAPMGWIMDTKERAQSIVGVRSVDVSGLTDPRMAELEALLAEINGVIIHFPVNKDEPTPEDAPKLAAAVDKVAELEQLAAAMQISVSLVIYGHADATGRDKYNYELSQERAKTVAAMLYARGSAVPVSTYGLGAQFAAPAEGAGEAAANPASRKIELRVRFTQGLYAGAVEKGRILP
ncbi:MAG: OmpA family protein [Candidatus Adiutrix sp.]|jgi:OOP family OmpA-OmpF porin|nr:OmpA family protein [Candidatus Adiutrix sp.]